MIARSELFGPALAFVVMVFSVGCAPVSRNSFSASSAECSRNFSSSGNMLIGQQFRTDATVQGARAREVLERLRTRMKHEGYLLVEMNLEDGVLQGRSRTTSGSYTEPVVIGAEQDGKDVLVTMSASTLAGQYTPESAAHEEFCKFVTEAQKLAYSYKEPERRVIEARSSAPVKKAKVRAVVDSPKAGSSLAAKKPASNAETKKPEPQADESTKSRY
jgi:hypothetical protein